LRLVPPCFALAQPRRSGVLGLGTTVTSTGTLTTAAGATLAGTAPNFGSRDAGIGTALLGWRFLRRRAA
jgi:hypothetical protein